MDAAGTVREFMAAGRLDQAVFNRVVGQLIRQAGRPAGSGGRAVRAYSEMVALLWDHGLVNAAAQLEVMWDELARRDAFSLFCGYRADSARCARSPSPGTPRPRPVILSGSSSANLTT